MSAQRGSLGQRVVLDPGQQPGGQGTGGERAAVRVAQRQGVQQVAFGGTQRDGPAQRHAGQQPQLGRFREQFHDRHVAQRPDRQPQPVQSGAAADEHLPAVPVRPAVCAADRSTGRSRSRWRGTATAGCCARTARGPPLRSGSSPDRPGYAPAACWHRWSCPHLPLDRRGSPGEIARNRPEGGSAGGPRSLAMAPG